MTARRGFTLVELLLAVAIFAVLAVSFYTAFSTGLLAHLRGEKDSETFQNARLMLNKIAAEFQNALYTSDLGLGGSASEIYFFILPEPENPQKEALPRRVTYTARKSGDGVSIYRDETPYSAKPPDEKPKKGREIGGGLRSAAFSYFREAPEETGEDSLLSPVSSAGGKIYEWVESWKSDEGFPLGIKVVLEYPDQKFERRIPSPLRFHQAEEEGAPVEAGGEVKR